MTGSPYRSGYCGSCGRAARQDEFRTGAGTHVRALYPGRANVSAYGQSGPCRDNIGYASIGQTMSGIAMVTGEEGIPPIRTGVPLIDRITALRAAIGALAALHEREVSGEGQSMDVCLADKTMEQAIAHFTEYDVVAAPVNTIPQAGAILR